MVTEACAFTWASVADVVGWQLVERQSTAN
jgi:hypothetical protein